MNSREALKLAILEYEKDLEFDENNQWVKNVLKGLKECLQDLDRLEKLEKENQKLNDFKYMFINCKKLTPLPKIPELEKYNKNAKKHHKDLEILEILKRNIYVADNTIYATPNELEKDDYNKLKEWYDNE